MANPFKSINEPDTPALPTRHQSINEPSSALDDMEPPYITALEPDGCTIGDADFTLVVRGTGFYPQLSMIHFAGHDEPTTYNADGSLSTGVKPSLWTEPVVVQCSVRNGDVESNEIDFDFADVAQEASSASSNVSRERKHHHGGHGHAGGHGRGGRSSRR